MNPLPNDRRRTARVARRGTSLIELVMVVTIIGILVSLSVPTFHRALEQSRADLAAANLRAIWSAERLYWLDNREFTNDLSALRSLGLLDSSIVDNSHFYVYDISSASADAFAAHATRVANARFNGSFGITDSGTITGWLSAPDEADLTPGFQ